MEHEYLSNNCFFFSCTCIPLNGIDNPVSMKQQQKKTNREMKKNPNVNSMKLSLQTCDDRNALYSNTYKS